MLKLLAIICLVLATAAYADYSQAVKSDHSHWHSRLSALKKDASHDAHSCGSKGGSRTKKWWSEWNHDFHSLCSEYNKAIDHWQSNAKKDGNFDLSVAKNAFDGWLSALGHIESRADRCDRSKSVPRSGASPWPFVGDRTPISQTRAHSKWSKAVHWEHSRVHSDISGLKKSVSKDISRCVSHAGSDTKKVWASWKSHFHSLCSRYSKALNSWQSRALHSQSKDFTKAERFHSAWISRLAAVQEFASKCNPEKFPSAANSVWFRPAALPRNLQAKKPAISAKFQKLVKKAGK